MALISGCGGSSDYDERVAYLREVGLRGIEVNNLLSEQNTQVTEEECRTASVALNDDSPIVLDIAGRNAEQVDSFKRLVDDTFIEACVSGRI
jgi:hypothetical protein